jgi:hypothetical protein
MFVTSFRKFEGFFREIALGSGKKALNLFHLIDYQF